DWSLYRCIFQTWQKKDHSLCQPTLPPHMLFTSVICRHVSMCHLFLPCSTSYAILLKIDLFMYHSIETNCPLICIMTLLHGILWLKSAGHTLVSHGFRSPFLS